MLIVNRNEKASSATRDLFWKMWEVVDNRRCDIINNHLVPLWMERDCLTSSRALVGINDEIRTFEKRRDELIDIIYDLEKSFYEKYPGEIPDDE